MAENQGDQPEDQKISKAKYKQLTSGNVFGTLRILVIGRPGVGKSTLIKLLLGLSDKKGPGNGKKQDISKEWVHPKLPLKIHETDVDIAPPADDDPNAHPGVAKRLWKIARGGNEKDLKEVEKFLKARQKKNDYSERVHLVWFVMSALDSKNASNAKVFKELSSHGELPIMIIVTHNDQDPEGTEYSRNVEAQMETILKHVEDKEAVKADIVRVKNDVEHNRIDDSALSLVSVKTREHLDHPELKAAWGAAQVVDVEEKIQLSARAIVAYKDAAVYTSPTGLIPGPHQTIVGSLLTGLCRALCQTWGVPKPFKKSLKSNLASQEVYSKQLSVLLQKFGEMGKGAVGMGPFAGLVTKAATPIASKVMTTATVATVSDSLALSITPVAVAAAAVGWVYASRKDAYNAMIAMVSLGIMVTGAILYVKASYDQRGWDESRSKSDYDKIIKEFVEQHGPDLKQHIGERHSVSDVFNPEKDREAVIKYLEEYFDGISSQHSKHGAYLPESERVFHDEETMQEVPSTES